METQKARKIDNLSGITIVQFNQRGSGIPLIAYLGVVIDLYSRRVVDAEPLNDRRRAAGITHGGVAQEAEEQDTHPL